MPERIMAHPPKFYVTPSTCGSPVILHVCNVEVVISDRNQSARLAKLFMDHALSEEKK